MEALSSSSSFQMGTMNRIKETTQNISEKITSLEVLIKQQGSLSEKDLSILQQIDTALQPIQNLFVIGTKETNVIEKPALPIEIVEASPFSTLYCENLSGGPLHMVINSHRNIEIDNDFFKGQALLGVRIPGEPLNNHPFQSIFEGRQRTIELQVQGSFKRQPRGAVFVGAEITSMMHLGLLKKALCNAILAFIRKFIRGVHVSFGDEEDMELPHIVAPFAAGCDRLLVTPPPTTTSEGSDGSSSTGVISSIPVLGTIVPESDADRTLRRSGKVEVKGLYDPNAIVTFSFNTMYVDLQKWEVCKLPMIKAKSLNDFWRDADLQFVVYDTPGVEDEVHPIKTNSYVAKLRMYNVRNGHAEKLPRFIKQQVAPVPAASSSSSVSSFSLSAAERLVSSASIQQDNTVEDEFDGLSEGESESSGDEDEEFMDCLDNQEETEEVEEGHTEGEFTTPIDDANDENQSNLSGQRRRRPSVESGIASLVSLSKSVSLSKLKTSMKETLEGSDMDSSSSVKDQLDHPLDIDTANNIIKLHQSSKMKSNELSWRCIGWIDLCERKNVNPKIPYYILVGKKKKKKHYDENNNNDNNDDENDDENDENDDSSSSSSSVDERFVLRTSKECEDILKASSTIERETLLMGSFSSDCSDDNLSSVSVRGDRGAIRSPTSTSTSISSSSSSLSSVRNFPDLDYYSGNEDPNNNHNNNMHSGLDENTINSQTSSGSSRISSREKMRRNIHFALKKFGKAGGTSACLDGDASGIVQAASLSLAFNSQSSSSSSTTLSSSDQATSTSPASSNNVEFDMKRNGNVLIPKHIISSLKPYGLLSQGPPKHLVYDGFVCCAVSESHWAEAWLSVRHHVIDVHDPTARKRILRIANKDIIQVNVSNTNEASKQKKEESKTGRVRGNSLIGGVFGKCSNALPACDMFSTIEVVTMGRIFYFMVRNTEKSRWIDSIGSVVSPVFAARLEWTRHHDTKHANNMSPRHSGFGNVGDEDDGSFNTFLEAVLPPQRSSLVTLAVGDSRHAFNTVAPQKWKHDKRKVLNCRKLFHHSKSFHFESNKHSSTTHMAIPHPVELVKKLLYYLLHHAPSNLTMGTLYNKQPWESNSTDERNSLFLQNSSPDQWSFEDFLDFSCLLKVVDLSLITTKEELACFNLNLYHAMVKHAQIIFSPPDSLLALTKNITLYIYFLTYVFVSMFMFLFPEFTSRGCYEVGDDVVSIGELEHLVLRYCMAPPDQLGATLFIPRGDAYSFRLPFAEPRLNFAINIGSRSNPSSVPVYTPSELNKQLDSVTCLALGDWAGNHEDSGQNDPASAGSGGGGGRIMHGGKRSHRHSSDGVVLKPGKGTATFPKIMQWYINDFGSDPTSLLTFSRKFLSPAQVHLLDDMMDGKKVKVKFHDFNSVCAELLPFETPVSIAEPQHKSCVNV